MPLVTFLSCRRARATPRCHFGCAGHPVKSPVRRANAPFRAIEVIRLPWLDRIYAWSLRRIFKYNFNNQALTAILLSPLSRL